MFSQRTPKFAHHLDILGKDELNTLVHNRRRMPMNKFWKFGKQALLLLTAAALIFWGASLVYGFANGDIGILRAGVKMIIVISLMTLTHDWWTKLAKR